MAECVFLENKTGEPDIHGCRLKGKCCPEKKHDRYQSCLDCQDSLTYQDPEFSKKWIDPLHITTRFKEQTDVLRNLLAGRPSFLVCGGPSASPMLPKLNQRGVFSLAVNNAAGNVVRPQAFVHTDPPIKFSHSIWQDPAIMKFVPIPKLANGRNNIRRKYDNVFEHAGHNTECPNVWGFRRNSWMTPDEHFFTDIGASWGNQNAGVKKTGQPKTVCTMLCGIRLLYYLGSRRIYLVGVDFNMIPGKEYSFNQAKENAGASDSNNHQFKTVNKWLCEMVENGTFKKFGLQIGNCYDRSGLRAFPHVPFEAALKDVIGDVEQTPDLSSWYNKDDCPKCTSWHVRVVDEQCECLRCGLKWESWKRPDYSKGDKRKFDKELEEKGIPK